MKKARLFLILTMLALVFVASGCQKSGENAAEEGMEKYYTVSFGLNDAETNQQEVATEDACTAIRKIITDKGFGYTEYITYGAYTENGKAVENVSLIYFLVYMEDSDVENIVSEAKKELNLKSVLVQESTDKFQLIEGSN